MCQKPKPPSKCSLTLKTYKGEIIPVVGEASVHQSNKLPLIVVESYGRPFLGRDWLHHLKLDWCEINVLSIMSNQQSSLICRGIPLHSTRTWYI